MGTKWRWDGTMTSNRDLGIPFSQGDNYQRKGIGNTLANRLPVFYEQLKDKLNFPMSWTNSNYHDFGQWKNMARRKVLELILPEPEEVPFHPVVIDQEDRGAYTACKVVFNLTLESRVLALVLIPKGEGPFPGLLLLHDHGSRFDIGKEKLIKPWNDPRRLVAAEEWSSKYFDGYFIGDRLAEQGYIVMSVDALGWGDRGVIEYQEQQGLACNLLHLGRTLAGLMAYEDLRAATFLASLSQVTQDAIGALGFSMGAYRAWQVAALSDVIQAAVAVCWMGTIKGLMVPANNQTRGQSAFYMTHPGLSNFLDYPDVASIAAPKPALFYNGEQDSLFPVEGVAEAYSKLREVWDSQNAGDKLETKLWPSLGHVFNKDQQDAVFAWLERNL